MLESERKELVRIAERVGARDPEDVVHTVCARFLRDGKPLDNIGWWVVSLRREVVDRAISAHSRYFVKSRSIYDADGTSDWLGTRASYSTNMEAMLDMARMCDAIDAMPKREREILFAFAKEEAWEDIEAELGIARGSLWRSRRQAKKRFLCVIDSARPN